MADFIEVMRQFDRMCKAHAGCVDCPLAIKGTVETKCSISSFVEEPEYIEREVMSWAAEHPEPVYPTWWSWLINEGVIEKGSTYTGAFDQLRTKSIPTDIAQKLGIEPKEM